MELALCESKLVSELILEGRWAMGQVTGERSGQIRELGLMKGRSKGMGQAGQYGQMSISLPRLNSVCWELQNFLIVLFPMLLLRALA